MDIGRYVRGGKMSKLTTKRKMGDKRYTYSTKYLKQLSKAVFYHFYDHSAKGCDVRIEVDGLGLTVGSTKFKGWRTPLIIPWTYKKTIRNIERIMESIKKKNAKRTAIMETYSKMWFKQIYKGRNIQH